MSTYKMLTRSEAYDLMRAGCRPQCRHNRERFYDYDGDKGKTDWMILTPDSAHYYETPVDGYYDQFRIEVE